MEFRADVKWYIPAQGYKSAICGGGTAVRQILVRFGEVVRIKRASIVASKRQITGGFLSNI